MEAGLVLTEDDAEHEENARKESDFVTIDEIAPYYPNFENEVKQDA